MTSPPIGGYAQPKSTPTSRTFKTQLILRMAIAASNAAASPSHRNNSLQAARQLFET
jgi:hypothetical protein